MAMSSDSAHSDQPVAEPSATDATDHAAPQGGLLTVSFLGLVVTQFLVALNDNMFRWLIIPIGKELVGQEVALTAGSVLFLLPFIVLAAPAGYLTDRFSKRTVMIGCKVAEIVIMTLGMAVILSGNIYLMLVVLFLMGAQSTMFSPSKYGSIPEIVRQDRISAANGVIGMTTMIAIILGTVAGGFLYSWTTPPSILVVHEEPPERDRLSELVRSSDFRAKEAGSVDEALESIRSGAPKLVLLDHDLSGTSGREAAAAIHRIAGNVSVVLMTPEATRLAAPKHDPEKTAWNGEAAGPDRFVAWPVDEGELRVAIEKLAGTGDPGVAGRNVLPGQLRWWLSAAALVGVAVVGWIASLFIGRLRPANPERRFPRNPAGQTARDLGALFARRALLLAALGSTYFWSLGCLAQLNIDWFARPELVTAQEHVGPLLGVLILGIGIGSALAGLWSRGKIELGLVPFGALGMAAFSMLLFTVPQGVGSPLSGPYYWACFWLLALGLAAGLYDIPLLAFLQHRSPEDSRGRILAAYNFMAFSGMLAASGLFWLLARKLGLSGRHIWLLAGLATVPVCLAICWLVFDRLAYLLVGMWLRIFYRVRAVGPENVPEEGGALLIANHVTWIDGLVLYFACPRPVRYIAHDAYIPGWWGRRLARDFRVIPIQPGRQSVVRSIRAAREALRSGDLVCIFPEGGLSRTGQINPFHPGFLTILKGTGVPVIPVHLGGLWGSIFSFEGGKWFWKWPRRLPYPVTVRFGSAIHGATDSHRVRRAVQDLEWETMHETKQGGGELIPARQFLRTCRRNLRREKVADSTGARLTGAALLTRALILRRLLAREVLADDEPRLGVLLPPSAAGVVANAAVSLDGRVAVNLNYTVSSEVMNVCIERAGIRHVLTSRSVMEKLKLEIDAELVYLEDFRDKATGLDKLAAAVQAWAMPIGWLERRLGLRKIDREDLLTIIFTSGSTGQPKGVMLTHNNVGLNVRAFNQVLDIKRDDVLVGILPFFHSFGYTVTLWSVLMLDAKGIYHFTPLEARQVGKLCGRHEATILIATPTFLRSYVRRCNPEDFASLEVVITGAEKLPPDVADAFEERFHVRPLEGYGTTELSPVVSSNVPPSRRAGELQPGPKEGTVGQPIPGVAAKIVDLETGEDLGVNQPGMLLIRGHNVMKGYLAQPELTAEVIRDGWYTTGDVALIDEEGYIRITGRQSRFSKIGGEMVPHLRVEEVLGQILDLGDEELRLMVTAVDDHRKGERLIVLHTGLEKPPDTICREMAEAGLPPIWVPSPDSFFQVREIPVLGTGKLDLRRARQLAQEKVSPPK